MIIYTNIVHHITYKYVYIYLKGRWYTDKGIGAPDPNPRHLVHLLNLTSFSKLDIWGSSWGRGFRFHWLAKSYDWLLLLSHWYPILISNRSTMIMLLYTVTNSNHWLHPVSLRRFPSFRTQPLEHITPLSMKQMGSWATQPLAEIF